MSRSASTAGTGKRKSLPGLIKNRLNILKAYMVKEENIADVSFDSLIHSLLQVDGLQKMILKRRMIVRSSLEGYNKITIEGRTVFWPPQADLDRVIDMYFEVFKPNSHQFDSHDTELHSGDVVIDIGGCEGYFSLKALEKGADTVFCFEPGRLAVKCLESTFAEEIKAGKVEVMNQILGAASGEIVFGDNPFDPTLGRVSGPKTSADMTYYRLPVTTIDKFCVEKQLRRLDFVKIDVEGSEMEVLQGATSSIVRFSPAIAIAAYHKPSHAKELQALIKSLDRDYTVKIHGLVDLGGIVRPVMLHCFKKARKRS